MENARRMRIISLNQVSKLLSHTLLKYFACIVSDRTFTVACSPYAGEMIVLIRVGEQKKLLLRRVIVEI